MKRKKSSIGCLFWIALILLILVIFLFNRSTIQTVLDNTGFLNLFQDEPSQPEISRIEEDPPQNEKLQPAPKTPAAEKPAPTEEIPVEVVIPSAEKEDVPPEAGATTDSIQEAKVRRSRLYFVMVDAEGNISLKGVVRPVYYKDSPLTETMNNLLKGLSTAEINMGLLSLIPDGTVLNSVLVRDGTAYLDFSENFLFNSFGVEGYTAQVQQTVFTALEFSTVKRVQILINGKKQDYMGIEGGIFIGEPLTRESF